MPAERSGRDARRPATRTAPKPEPVLTPAGLERSALWHLQRRALTEHELRTALGKKVKRAAAEHGPSDDAGTWIDALVARLRDSLLVDDDRVARARVDSGRARGLSKRRIADKLRQKGVSADVAKAAIDAVDAVNDDVHDDGVEHNPDLDAARILVRRRRLRDKDPQKALAALARQGFSYAIAKRALAVDDDDR
jgi:regulatory protein